MEQKDLNLIVEASKIVARASMELTALLGMPVELTMAGFKTIDKAELKLIMRNDDRIEELRRVDIIFNAVGSQYMLSAERIRSKCRDRPIPDAKKCIMLLLSEFVPDITDKTMAQSLNVQRSTVTIGREKALDLLQFNKQFSFNFHKAHKVVEELI